MKIRDLFTERVSSFSDERIPRAWLFIGVPIVLVIVTLIIITFISKKSVKNCNDVCGPHNTIMYSDDGIRRRCYCGGQRG
jgi:hypothetical protein